ncbi:hypothetical protein K501DRAFT_278990 [Backusella circina FSU 941]|nr:hypothetical protein K501DRAFT_278990 [Backusella circina FSU 941]
MALNFEMRKKEFNSSESCISFVVWSDEISRRDKCPLIKIRIQGYLYKFQQWSDLYNTDYNVVQCLLQIVKDQVGISIVDDIVIRSMTITVKYDMCDISRKYTSFKRKIIEDCGKLGINLH